jgi:hypothetical protein
MLLAILASAGLAVAAATGSTSKQNQAVIKNLITFGDSYTDNGRLGYYINHGGAAPPAGVYHTVSNTTASGGLAWGQWVARRTGANYADYAVSGATCSNKLISRQLAAINRPFPSVVDDEIPSFLGDLAVGASFLGSAVQEQHNHDNKAAKGDETVYALWIGTNDLGFGAFLSDSQAPGTSIVDFVDCVWAVFDALYHGAGARRFVLLAEAPLEISPLYAPTAMGGTANSQFWGNKTSYNTTEYSKCLV